MQENTTRVCIGNERICDNSYEFTGNQSYGLVSVKSCEENDNHRLSDMYMEILPQKSRYPIMVMDKLSESPS